MPGSPTTTLYEAIGEVELVPTSQAIAGPNQATGASAEFRNVRRFPFQKRPGHLRFKGRVQSVRRGQDGSDPIPNAGKALIAQVSQPSTPDCMIVEQWGHPPSQAPMVWERRITLTPCAPNKEKKAENDHSPWQSARKKKKVPTSKRSGSEDGSWEQMWPSTIEESDEEVTPSPDMCKIFTRLQERRLLSPGGGAFGISGLASQSKGGKPTKKHRTT